MITMDKKYRCRDGVPVTVLAVGLNAHGSVVAVRHTTNSGDVVITLTSDGRWGNYDTEMDIIEIGPYDGFKINDLVMVSTDSDVWFRRYFAGVNGVGRPLGFLDGTTSGTNTAVPRAWSFCRRPTPEELME